MPRVEVIQAEIQRLLRAAPFRPFALTLENGDRVIIEHPENIAFDPAPPEGMSGADEFYVISNRIRLFSTFGAVTSVTLVDRGELAG
jgi:hypothetical protein